ncbi:MAG: tetratricopeptide repeat protein [Cyanobacteria bacterium P01_G01_bin.54]
MGRVRHHFLGCGGHCPPYDHSGRPTVAQAFRLLWSIIVGERSKVRIGLIPLLLSGLMVGAIAPIPFISPTLAQTGRPRTPEDVEDAFDPEEDFEDPFRFTELEPLLPDSWPEQPLTEAQQRTLEQEIVELDAQANAAWLAEDPDGAFGLWYRTLRLHQALDYLSEVRALGRIGEFAWENERTADVQTITRRLEFIQADTAPPTDEDDEPRTIAKPMRSPELTAALAKAMAQVRRYPNAVQLYEELLTAADTRGDGAAQERLLLILAELHRNWFRFEAAIAATQRLLTLAQAQFDAAMVQTHLANLAYLYEETEQWQAAIDHQEALFSAYQQKTERLKLAPLRLAIGRNHDRLGERETASTAFQAAFDLAWAQQQYATASDALTELAELYVRNGQPETAITIYQEQLKAADYASDLYRKLTTWDRLGQLYGGLQRYSEAIAAFEAGRQIAITLGHREAYFEERIQAVRTARFE